MVYIHIACEHCLPITVHFDSASWWSSQCLSSPRPIDSLYFLYLRPSEFPSTGSSLMNTSHLQRDKCWAQWLCCYLVYPRDHERLFDKGNPSIRIQCKELLHLLTVGNLRNGTELLQKTNMSEEVPGPWSHHLGLDVWGQNVSKARRADADLQEGLQEALPGFYSITIHVSKWKIWKELFWTLNIFKTKQQIHPFSIHSRQAESLNIFPRLCF